MVKLEDREKQQMCSELAMHLQKLRSIIKLSQEELGELCGLSRTRISQIETNTVAISWIQFMAFMMVFLMNYDTKQYIFANRLFAPRFLQFLQCKEECIPPDDSIEVRKEFVMPYDEFQKFYARFNSGNQIGF